MAIVLRYVDTHGLIKERFVGLLHVMETSSSFLKSSIDTFFAKHNLSSSRLRGQGYDGASNMCGEYNGLKAKFLEEKKSSYYVHCFAHQLQLVVVMVVKKHLSVGRFFDKIATLLNVVCASWITDTLSRVLQMKDQETVEAVSMVESTKAVLQNFIESGFDKVLAKFLQEFGDRLNEVNMELLKNMAALSPHDSFSQLNASTLLRLSELYPYDFDDREKINLEHQLSLYHQSNLKDTNFANLKSIADLSKMMVNTRKHLSYHLVYRLLKPTLVLPVATAFVERSFSAMKRLKSSLRNRISDDFLNACVILCRGSG
ncbi:uncharacterized protein LOC143597763 [Bidens hawaiensis]|uniref:uncharacterized protein LOC143597763 n=1 Tax=Bidens hawaiensis TaxID=980011 RepID=UPI0040492943